MGLGLKSSKYNDTPSYPNPPWTPASGDSNKWDGWATTTYDGPGDATGRFCGALLEGVPNDNNDNNNAGVSVPWPILCREFKNKNCLLNHMCPDCLKCKKNCGTTSVWMARQKAKDCPPVESYENDINKYGICYEAQATNIPINQFNPNDFKPDKNFPLYGKENGKDINDSSIVDKDAPIYTLKLAVGCGGNCKPCSSSIDCVNKCNDKNLTINPCDINNNDSSCKYLTWSNKNQNTITKENINGVTENNSCPLTYDPKSGKFVNTGGYRNWCSGANMHFDFTNQLKGLTIFGHGNGAQIIRYRRVQCPKPSDECT